MTFSRLILRVSFSMSLIFLTSCTVQPHPTSSENLDKTPPWPVVSLCHRGSVPLKKLVKQAEPLCPRNNRNLSVWQQDVLLNNCPILLHHRTTFLCQPEK